MTKAKEFQANATQCDKDAARAEDPEAKRLLRETAKNWHKLAQHARLREQ